MLSTRCVVGHPPLDQFLCPQVLNILIELNLSILEIQRIREERLVRKKKKLYFQKKFGMLDEGEKIEDQTMVKCGIDFYTQKTTEYAM